MWVFYLTLNDSIDMFGFLSSTVRQFQSVSAATAKVLSPSVVSVLCLGWASRNESLDLRP